MTAIDPNELRKQFKESVCAEIDIVPQGIGRYSIYTPFSFDDGDHYVIILQQQNERWVLTDDGHTFMHMSYGNVEFNEGSRRRIIDESLAFHGLTDDNGVLSLLVPPGQFGDALYSFVHGICKVTDVTRNVKESTRTSFYREMGELITSIVPSTKLAKNWHDADTDPSGNYPVDFRIIGGSKPWMVFGIHSNSKCKDVTVVCLHREKIEPEAGSIAIFEDQAMIGRKHLARLSDTIGKQFSSLHDQQRIEHYFKQEVLGDAA